MNIAHGREREAARSFRAPGQRSPVLRVGAAALIVVSAISGSLPSCAQTTFGAESLLDELEKAFWACDYGATISLVDFYSAIACSQFTEALRQQKFDGNFDAMLVWWRQHKDAKYQELSRVGGVPDPRVTP